MLYACNRIATKATKATDSVAPLNTVIYKGPTLKATKATVFIKEYK